MAAKADAIHTQPVGTRSIRGKVDEQDQRKWDFVFSAFDGGGVDFVKKR